MTPGTLVLIKWLDAFTPRSNGWLDREDVDEWFNDKQVVDSVGFLHSEDMDYYHVMQTVGADQDSYLGLFSIPKGCVKKISVLRKAK